MPATWGKNTLTNQALTMMNQALGISAITFTKAVTITDDITGDSVSQLQALTSVNYKQLRTPKAIATQDNKSRLGVTIDNSDVNEDYIYYGVGLYAKQNSTNQEVLFSVIPLTAGATMIAKENNSATASIYLDLYTDIVRGTQVTIMVSNSGTLSREDVQQMISQSLGKYLAYPSDTASTGIDFNTILGIGITRIINDTTVVNAPSGFSGTGYLTTIGSGDKTAPIVQDLDDTINSIRLTRYFNSTTNAWSEWNAYAKTVDVNQQLDKKVTDNGDGSIVVNGKTYTPADDSTVIHNNSLNQMLTDDSGIIIGNDADFGLIKRSGHKGGLAIGSGNSFHFMITTDATLSNKSLYSDVWSIGSDGKVSILGGASFTPADDSKVIHKDPNTGNTSEDVNFTGKAQKDNKDLLTADQLPSDLARTGQTNTFSLLQTFSQGMKTLQAGSYDDANSLVNEGLYFNTNLSIKNGAGSITAGFIQVISGYWDRVRQFMYSDVTNNLIYTRVSSDNGSTWSDWIQMMTSDNLPSTLADTTKPANFTAGLQSGGINVQTDPVSSDLAAKINANGWQAAATIILVDSKATATTLSAQYQNIQFEWEE